MNPISVLMASVTHIESAAEAALAWGLGLAATLKQYASQPDAIMAIASELEAKAQHISDAIIANTPAAPSSAISVAANERAAAIEADPAHPNNLPVDPAPSGQASAPLPDGMPSQSGEPIIPAIVAISPTSGKAGDLISITGSGFDGWIYGTDQVMFGDNPSTSFTVQNDILIVNVQVPPGAGGVTVSVVKGGNVSASVGSFSYVTPAPAPIPDVVSPPPDTSAPVTPAA